MPVPDQPPVVVGVDGTAAGLAAVRLAARESISRGTVLSVIHAFTWPGGTDLAPARRAASRILGEAVATAQRSTPGVGVRGQLEDGPAGAVLRRWSRRAALLVVGADELAATGRLPPGSTLLETASQAWCPVIVARGTRPATGRVIAAVDGSAPSVLARGFAEAEAARRGVPLDVVEVTGGDPGPVLVTASRTAGLIVLGPRGAGGAVRFGSVAHELLLRGGCPTVFVHGLCLFR
ncbi:universal stress protein [Actinoplanes sp. NPDC051851]|uniref:universal stress protein n=1 Tax=Actinoplanes sp. NPDC051851 TaxID=3154753 RepID=UPI00344A39BB